MSKRFQVVNHDGCLARWLEDSMKLIENTIKIQAMMKNTGCMDVINEPSFREIVFCLIGLNEFNGGFMQFESFARDLQGLCGASVP